MRNKKEQGQKLSIRKQLKVVIRSNLKKKHTVPFHKIFKSDHMLPSTIFEFNVQTACDHFQIPH